MTRITDEELRAARERASNGHGVDSSLALALLDEITALRKGEQEAWRRGAEWMRRDIAEELAEQIAVDEGHDLDASLLRRWEEETRAWFIPATEEPHE